MIPQDIIEEVIGNLIERRHSYLRPLPVDLVPWYVYVRDVGHSIVCRLKDSVPDEDIAAYMVVIPVRTVLRGYEMNNGIVVVDWPFDPDLGLMTPYGDDEL